MSEKIKFVVIGCGHIGYRHAALIQRNEESDLVAIVDTDVSKKKGIISQFNVPFFSSIDDLFSSELEFDVANIATPNNEHCNQSIQALKKGVHVVCEKPMALSKSDCANMISISKESEKHIFCVMQNRYSPPSAWLKEIVSAGSLGDIFMVQINCFWNRDERYYKASDWKGKLSTDGGTLFTQFSHFVDLMYWVFGDIKNINKQLRDNNHADLTEFEDSGVVFFDFLNGGIGTINYSTSVWDKNLESSITVIAEKGSIKIGGQYMDEVKYCNIKNYEMPKLPPTNSANDYGDYKGSAANHHYVIENVIDTLKNRNVATTNAMAGLKVVDIIERIYET